LLNPATNSAIPSNTPIKTAVYPKLLRYMGIIGYNISLAKSVNKLTKESSSMLRVMGFKTSCFGDEKLALHEPNHSKSITFFINTMKCVNLN
jgi:hypothetical protein